ncbi:MAG TPA: hypothetical protein GXX51_05790 [Firmicutes bacterium]|nr:hypothetical protein [Bacillota bacterium]
MPYVDYTSRDFAGLGVALEQYIRQRFPQWTDFNVSNMGNVLKELFQYVGDTLHYYLDKQANECFFDTVTERENMLSLCRWLGYTPRGYVAATANLTVTLASPAAFDVVIPKGTQVKTKDLLNPLVFEFQSDCVIKQGQTVGVAVVKHAQTRRETFEADGSPNQAFKLYHQPYLGGATLVKVNGTPWMQVEDFLDARADTPAYTVSVDANFRATVLFGDGTNGMAPSGVVEIIYETGGGMIGNVPAGHISVIEGVFTDLAGNPVSLSVINLEQASGGMDPETLDEIRWKAPRSIKTNYRTVTREDFEINAEGVPGVVRALAQTRNEDPTLQENFTRVYIVPSGGGTPSLELIQQVEAELRYNKPVMLTHEFEVTGANYVPVDITGTIYARPGYDASQVQTAALEAIDRFFDYTALDPAGEHVIDFGKAVYMSQIMALIQNVQGVKSVNLTSPTGDVTVGANQIPAKGAVNLTVVV